MSSLPECLNCGKYIHSGYVLCEKDFKELQKEYRQLLNAVKMAYRKHHLDDSSVGWDELSNVLMITLCNTMGDKAFQTWLDRVSNETK